MDKLFVSRLESPWGAWYLVAGDEGVIRIQYEGEAPQGIGEVPYDLAHAWEAYATGLSDSLHVPIDLMASPEAQLFYLAIRQIPRGGRRTVADIAQEAGIGQETAHAYLSDCPLPLAIPLHRVCEWQGVPDAVKEAMLAFEREHPRLPKPEIPWAKGK